MWSIGKSATKWYFNKKAIVDAGGIDLALYAMKTHGTNHNVQTGAYAVMPNVA
jgi:hypothetical protein